MHEKPKMKKDPKAPPSQSKGGKIAAIYCAFTEEIERIVLGTDLRDKAEFHGLLFILNGLCDGDILETFLEIEHPDLRVMDTIRCEINNTETSKMSRWVNGRATPAKLAVRQRVIASALKCLKNGRDSRMAFPLRIPRDISRCNTDGITENEMIGIGVYEQQFQ